ALPVRNMVQNQHLAKSISDAGWSHLAMSLVETVRVPAGQPTVDEHHSASSFLQPAFYRSDQRRSNLLPMPGAFDDQCEDLSVGDCALISVLPSHCRLGLAIRPWV